MKTYTKSLAASLLSGCLLLQVAAASQIRIYPGQGVELYQIDYKWRYSRPVFDTDHGLIEVDLAKLKQMTGLTNGYLNVATDKGWVVSNLLIRPSEYKVLSTHFHLGNAVGENVDFLNAEIIWCPSPLENFQPTAIYPWVVGPRSSTEEGYGTGGSMLGSPPAPGTAEHQFRGLNYYYEQPLHKMQQTATNQCGPMGVAASFDYLKRRFGLAVPHPHLKGLETDGDSNSLVGALGREMGRTPTSRTDGPPVDNDHIVQGKIDYLDKNDLTNVVVQHQCENFNDMTSSDGRVISKSSGFKPTFEFIEQQIMKGCDVELCWNRVGTADERIGHCVTVVGAGRKNGIPFIRFIHDRVQSHDDASDSEGLAYDETYLIDTDGDERLNLVGYEPESEVSLVISECMPTTAGQLTGVTLTSGAQVGGGVPFELVFGSPNAYWTVGQPPVKADESSGEAGPNNVSADFTFRLDDKTPRAVFFGLEYHVSHAKLSLTVEAYDQFLGKWVQVGKEDAFQGSSRLKLDRNLTVDFIDPFAFVHPGSGEVKVRVTVQHIEGKPLGQSQFRIDEASISFNP